MFFIGHIISIRKVLRATWNVSGKLSMKLDVAQIRLEWDKSGSTRGSLGILKK